jgi:DNA polymerase III alpha subunit (gram-positive type)
MLEDNQIYIIVDIELNGLVPGQHSIISIGAVASTVDQEVDSFYKKLLPLDDLSTAPETMDWWKTQPEAWQEVNTDAEPAATVIEAFREWVESFGKSPVFVASPLVLDYPFIKWYLHKFGGEQLFEDSEPVQRTLDLASFTAGKLNIPLARARRMQLPPEITQGMPEHSHKAIDDARGYGAILRNVFKSSTGLDG